MPVVTKTFVKMVLLLGALMLSAANPAAAAAKAAPASNWTKNAVTLTAGDESFLALYTAPAAATSKVPPRGGIILLPGRGGHRNWRKVIRPLRLRLPKHGWATLAITLPPPTIPGSDPTNFVTAVDARIKAAIEYLHKRGLTNVVLIGYDLGAGIGAQYLALHSAHRIHAFVGISMGNEGFGPAAAPGPALANIRLPILDLYGQHDLPSVRNPAASKARRGKRSADPKSAAPYVQVILPGANHSFRGKKDALVAKVQGWLSRYATGPQTSHLLRMAKR